MEKEEALNEWEPAKSDLSNNTLTLTEREAHCVARTIQSTLYVPDKGVFYGCYYCRYAETCVPARKNQYCEDVALYTLKRKLHDFTDVDLTIPNWFVLQQIESKKKELGIEHIQPDLEIKTLILTEQEAHCVARTIQAAVYVPDKGAFYGCNFCRYAEKCVPARRERRIKEVSYYVLRSKLDDFTGVNLRTMFSPKNDPFEPEIRAFYKSIEFSTDQ